MKRSVVYFVVPITLQLIHLKKDPVQIPFQLHQFGFDVIYFVSKAYFKPKIFKIIEVGKIYDLNVFYDSITGQFIAAIMYYFNILKMLRKHRPLFIILYRFIYLIFPLIYLLKPLFKYIVVTKMDFGRVTNYSLYKKIYIYFIAKFSDIIIVESSEGFKDLYKIRPLPLTKVRIIPNGWSNDILQASKLRNLPKENVILTVARIHPIKGIDTLIEAFALISHKYPDWKLRIVGPIDDKNYFHKLLEKIEKYGLKEKCSFEGYKEGKDLAMMYGSASIFVLPSYAEGFPLARIEAMAFCLPVITTNTGGAEIIGDAGLIVEVSNAKALADALELLINNPDLRREMGIKACKKAEKLEWKNIVLKILASVIYIYRKSYKKK